MAILDRLKLYLATKRLSARELERLCGISNGVLGRLSQSTSPRTLKRIEDNTDLNIQWLLTGAGEMLRADQPAPSVDSTSVKSDESPHMIPFYDAETTGSFSGLVGASDTDATILGYINAGSWFDHRETAAIRHTGDSMTEYPSGCVLALRQIHEKRLLVPGRNYVIETSEYRVTKRVQLGSAPDRIALYSSNTERYPDGRLIYEPFEIELSDIRRIFSILGYIVNLSGDPRFIPT